jgi:uncharacterized protein
MRDDISPALRRIAAGTAAAGAALASWAVLIEPRWLDLTRPVIHIRKLHPDLEGLRIALLTDLHLGEGTPASLVRRACRMAMAERPHLIAVTGDFAADSAGDRDPALQAISALRAPLGVYAVPGNHDHVVGIEAWRSQVQDSPVVQDLTNRAIMIEVNGARLCVAGVDDFGTGSPRLDELPPPEERDATILLAHNPDQAEQLRRAYDAVDLVLSGHTHGGQVRLPWVGAVRQPNGQSEVYDEGLRRRPWTQVYTSRGVGTVHLPIRFLCRPEVAVLRLTSAPRGPRGG